MVMLEYTTKISIGGPNSLRTVIPKEVLRILELEQGDKIHWKVDLNERTTVSIEKFEDTK
jgi:bifunctional DNA-binding transcriptional regulator/antitoxin component of YhaV-PrlF toxin-antitoxin module